MTERETTIQTNFHVLVGKERDGENADTYDNVLEQTLDLVETDMEEIMQRGSHIKKEIDSIKEGSIPTELLENEKWKKLMMYIEETNKPYVVPQASKIEEFTKWSAIEYGNTEAMLFIRYKIPCLDASAFKLYEVRSLAVPQFVHTGKIASTYIEPANRYLLIRGKEYHNLKIEELHQCKESEQVIICPKRRFNMEKQPSCEFSLLMGIPTNYSKCDIRYKNTHVDSSYKIGRTRSWLYTVDKLKNLTIHCEYGFDTSVQIKGTRIIKLYEGCELYLENEITNAEKNLINAKRGIIIPKAFLNLETLSRILEIDGMQVVFFKFAQSGEEKFWNIIKLCEEFYEQNSTETKHVRYRIMIALGGLGAIITIMMIKCCRKKTQKEMPEPNIEIEKIDEEIELINQNPNGQVDKVEIGEDRRIERLI